LKIWTYEEARDRVEKELDLEEEDFISENEMVGYFNAAIDEAESTIHDLFEDYFLTNSALTMVSTESDISLPTNIYALKIRGLIYINGSLIYPVRRIRGQHVFQDIATSNSYGSSEEYRYILRNDSAANGYKIQLVPTSRESGAYLTLWYLRNANRIPLVGEAKDGGGTYSLSEVEATKIDIPEFINFVVEVVKGFCMAKENGGTIPPAQASLIQQQRTKMEDTLENAVPDNDDEVIQDLSHYQEHE
jgi:hypothetical protein